MGTVAHPELWPLWTIAGAASTLFPFLLMPVYVIFISRIALAWSLDRQVPEWLGAVSSGFMPRRTRSSRLLPSACSSSSCGPSRF